MSEASGGAGLGRRHAARLRSRLQAGARRPRGRHSRDHDPRRRRRVLGALDVAGLPTDRFFFAGFLPPRRRRGARALAALAARSGTLVFFEIAAAARRERWPTWRRCWATAPAAVARELTKLHEEVRRGAAGRARRRLRRGRAAQGRDRRRGRRARRGRGRAGRGRARPPSGRCVGAAQRARRHRRGRAGARPAAARASMSARSRCRVGTRQGRWLRARGAPPGVSASAPRPCASGRCACAAIASWRGASRRPWARSTSSRGAAVCSR